MANPHPSKSFKPGESGNPNGRPPKGYSITETIKAMMAEKPEIKQALSTKVIEMALKGDLAAIKLVWGYLEGMPTFKSEVSGPDGEPLIIVKDASNTKQMADDSLERQP